MSTGSGDLEVVEDVFEGLGHVAAERAVVHGGWPERMSVPGAPKPLPQRRVTKVPSVSGLKDGASASADVRSVREQQRPAWLRPISPPSPRQSQASMTKCLGDRGPARAYRWFPPARFIVP